MTPEQWVQYRAAMASQPQLPPPQRKAVPNFAHQRHTSSGSMNKLQKRLSKTPPPRLSRTPSGDWGQYAHVQDESEQRTPPTRPHSRGAGSALYTQPHTQPQTNLSAKEQMQVARATGTPLLNYTTNADKKQQEVHQPGLFGAIAAREKEKQESKRLSMNNPAVQQAIVARQQQQMEAEIAAQQAHYQAQMQRQMAQQQAYATEQQARMQQQVMQQQQQRDSWYGLPQPPMTLQQRYYGGAQPQDTIQSGPNQSLPGENFTSPSAQRLWERQQPLSQQQQQQQQQQWQQARR